MIYKETLSCPFQLHGFKQLPYLFIARSISNALVVNSLHRSPDAAIWPMLPHTATNLITVEDFRWDFEVMGLFYF